MVGIIYPPLVEIGLTVWQKKQPPATGLYYVMSFRLWNFFDGGSSFVMMLENKLLQKLKLSKSNIVKKCAPKQFFSIEKNVKDLDE